ncbi:lysosomal endosomal membrane protein, putative [Bodo saltans]|uniref:Phospholipase B-like n=1 Tax=Bodo saltans TaxID=75058 RepID=A0A0S4JII6_BODSA|nr:lysosomal endosomal membrane protein, putative [Bodo saltans]|eukprot:CUG90165.1 lysosomal endosomal membrane protein, putative [Bodo saltans]
MARSVLLFAATALLAVTIVAPTLVGAVDPRKLASIRDTIATSTDFINQTFRLYGNKSAPYTDANLTLVQPNAAAPESLDLLVTVVFNESFTEIGWDFLQVTPDPNFFATPASTAAEDETAVLQAQRGYYYAGYAEAAVTAAKMEIFYNNNNYNCTPEETTWINAHLSYVQNMIIIYTSGTMLSNTTPEALFWRQVGNQWMQLQGLADGLSAHGVPGIAFADIFRFNFRYEIGDIANAVNPPPVLGKDETAVDDHRFPLLRDLHCSALVKITSNDLFFSHDTWSGFTHMIRQYKVYRFQIVVAMSGYAGQIHSGDDWYITSTALAAMETTNGYFGTALAREFIKPPCVSEFMRVMAANFLAQDGRQWTSIFATHPSGTYCNQYMVVDFKLYSPGQTPAELNDNLLWIAEEMPGNVTVADVTSVVREQGYWASFNIPYFPDTYKNSGFAAQEEVIGDFFSYTKYARPQIFKRNQSQVVDLETMQDMMQLNEWKSDPLSVITNCSGQCDPVNNPTLVIAARGDLTPRNASLPINPNYAQYLKTSAFGATDSKIASYSMMVNGMQASIFCGPTPQQPVFSWSGYGVPAPNGAVDRYDFSWEFLMQELRGREGDPPSNDSSKTNLIVGLTVGIAVGLVVIFVAARHVVKRRSESQYDYKAI